MRIFRYLLLGMLASGVALGASGGTPKQPKIKLECYGYGQSRHPDGRVSTIRAIHIVLTEDDIARLEQPFVDSDEEMEFSVIPTGLSYLGTELVGLSANLRIKVGGVPTELPPIFMSFAAFGTRARFAGMTLGPEVPRKDGSIVQRIGFTCYFRD